MIEQLTVLSPNSRRDWVTAIDCLWLKSLIKHQTAARLFEARYGQTFDTFRTTIIKSQPDSRTEQDYYDWELAVTGIEDMTEEIVQLQGVRQQL